MIAKATVMKRTAALLLALLMALPLFACENAPGEDEDTGTEPVSVETDTETREDTESDSVTETESETEEETVIMLEALSDVRAFLESITIFQLGSSYAVVNGERLDMGAAAIFDENALFPADFVEERGLGVIAEEDIVEKDGIRYTKLNAFRNAGKNVKILVGDKVIVSDSNYEVAEDIMDEYARRLDNMYAVGAVYSAAMTGSRPVLFETDEMLAEAKAKAEAKVEPWYSEWKKIESRANNALLLAPNPNTGKSATQYRLAACKDFINARYLALAYLYTEDAKYLDGAVKYLMTYAEPMLGTDEYLDYSAATTDGQADIGLNIAAPLTAACDVYSLVYADVSEDDKAVIEAWIRAEADLCVKGHKYWIDKNYYGEQYGNNHLSSHLMGIIAAAYVLEDSELLAYATNDKKNKADLCEMVTKAILVEGDKVYGADTDSDYVDGEIYDRYRSIQSNGFGYAMYHLKFMTHAGIMLYHNGVDIFSYIGENGENLLLPFHTYADYLIQNDITLGSGHYSNDKSLNRENAYSTYSIAYYVYKDARIGEVLDAFVEQRVQCNEIEVLGISTPYLYAKQD